MTNKPIAPGRDDAMKLETGRTILVAEDDEGLNKLICRALKEAGYKTKSAFTGKDAIALAGEHVNAILLLDLKLPDMNGEEVIGKLSQFQPPVPFLVLTGQGDEKVAVQMMKLGARDYLTKDLNILEMLPGILGRLITHLEISRRLHEAEEDKKSTVIKLDAFRKIATLIDDSITTICRYTLNSIVELTGSKFGFFGFLNNDESIMTIHSWSGEAMKGCSIESRPSDFSIAQAGVWAEAVRQRRPFILNNYSAAHHAKNGLPHGHVPLTRLMVVPVFSQGKIVSVAAVANRQADYTEEEVAQIQSLTENLWILIERKKNEQKLRDSEFYLKKAQEMGHIGTWELNVAKNILTWTEENYRIFGVPIGQPLTLESFLGCIHPDDLDFVGRKWNEALNHVPYDIEHRIIADGKVKWVREKAEVEFDEKGRALRGIGFTQDITNRKNTEMALQKEMQVSQRYLDIAGVMLVALDSEGNVSLINRKGCEILEVSEKEALGVNWFENFLPENMIDEVKGVFRKLMAGETELVKHYQNPVRTKKGKECLISFNNTILKDENNTITGILFSGEDITEAKKMEEQLRQSEKMQAIGQLAGGVAHDFNNQLAGIMSFAELIKNKAGGNGEVQFFADHILSIVGRSADLTRQLLAFSRKGKYRNENVDMHKLIVEVVSILKHSIDRRIEISQHLSASTSTVKGDPSQLQNALLNLALNARDAMETGGRLHFLTKTVKQDEEGGKLPSDLAPGSYLRIEVRDTGKGMDSDIMKHVFEPFFTTKEQGKGTGMGLAAVYGTIRHHQGVILADSTPGKGTVFSMYLPVVETAAEVSGEAGAKPAGPGKGGHIVFVDDEKFLRTSAQLILELAGFTVTLCADGGEVVELYKKMGSQIDLILMDMMMPGMCGNDAFRELKNLDPNVKVIFLSGYSMDDEARELMDQGVLGFINKPFQEADLLGKIAEVLG